MVRESWQVNSPEFKDYIERQYEQMLNESDTSVEDEPKLTKLVAFVTKEFADDEVQDVAYLLEKVYHMFIRAHETRELKELEERKART